MKSREGNNKELKNKPTTTNAGRHIFGETHSRKIDQLRQLEPITFEEICASICDDNPNRLTLCHLYNEMCDAVETNTANLVQASLSKELTEVNAMKNFHQLATICDHVNRILTPQNQTNAHQFHCSKKSRENSQALKIQKIPKLELRQK